MLNYTIPPFQFLIGSFDASQYLDSISLSVPMHEPGQALLWAGQFVVSNNLEARLAGLSDADFSERSMPARWRPYQQPVRLNIRGYQSPVFRIENYRYNSQTRTGEGTLTQIPTAVAGDRPGVQIGTTVDGSIGSAISKLLDAAFLGATVNPGRSVAGDSGVLDVPLTTRDGWADALRLSSLSWHWLTVDTSEAIRSIDGSGGGTIFTRTLNQVEVVPDLAAIFQTAKKVIVTGARQVVNLGTGNGTVATVPTAPRPKFKTTEEKRPAGTVFSSLGSSTTPIVFEEKTIIYQYFDDDRWAEYLPLFGNPLTAFLYDIQSVTQSGIDPYGQLPTDLNIPLQTITIKRQPIGYLFPSTGTDVTLVEAEVIIESYLRKLTLKPTGVLFPSTGTSTTLVVEKREDLTSELIPPGTQLTPAITGAGGQPQQYEPRPRLESPQPIATRPLKIEVLRGESNTSPIGWTPVLAKPLAIDFGFLPDAGRANFLAAKIAAREQWRRDQVLVDMPIPDEWLAAGWPLLASCQVGGDVFLMDGCAISISDGIAKFGFAGARRGSYALVGGVPTGILLPVFNILSNLDSAFAVEIEIISAVLPPVVIVSSDVAIEIVPEIVIATSLAVVSVVTIELISEITIASSIAVAGMVVIEFVPEIAITSLVSGGSPSGSGILNLPFDTNLFDISAVMKSVTNSNVIISTAQSVFGGGSAYFNGTNASLAISRDGSTGVDLRPSALAAYTIEMWLRPEALGGNVITNYNLPGGAQANTLAFQTSVISNGITVFANPATVINQWQHLAIVVDNVSPSFSCYFEGILIATVANNFPNSAGTLYIGGSPGDNNIGNAWYKGWIDNIVITPAKKYTTNFTVPTTP